MFGDQFGFVKYILPEFFACHVMKHGGALTHQLVQFLAYGNFSIHTKAPLVHLCAVLQQRARLVGTVGEDRNKEAHHHSQWNCLARCQVHCVKNRNGQARYDHHERDVKCRVGAPVFQLIAQPLPWQAQ